MGKAKYDVTSVLTEVEGLHSKIKEYESQIDRLELQSKSCNLELIQLKNGIKKVESDIQKSIEQKESVEHNIKVQKEIDDSKEKLKKFDEVIAEINDDIININGNIRIAENTIQTVNDSIDKLESMEQKYEGYEYYLQCVKRDGIPYELISDILPKLEVENTHRNLTVNIYTITVFKLDSLCRFTICNICNTVKDFTTCTAKHIHRIF